MKAGALKQRKGVGSKRRPTNADPFSEMQEFVTAEAWKVFPPLIAKISWMVFVDECDELNWDRERVLAVEDSVIAEISKIDRVAKRKSKTRR